MYRGAVVLFIPSLDGEGGEPASAGSPGGVKRLPPLRRRKGEVWKQRVDVSRQRGVTPN
jgi:hypothetical protein